MSTEEKIPFFSIVIAVYNTGVYLRPCLESVRAQTFADFEAILIDDGSSDGSPAVCDEYARKDSRFRVFHLEHQGTLLAKRQGILRVCGRYVVHCDSDDLLSPLLLETLLKTIRRENAEFVLYGRECIDVNDGVIQAFSPLFGCGAEPVRLDDKEPAVREMLSSMELHPLCVKCASRELTAAAVADTQYDRALLMGDDVILSLALIENARSVVYLPVSLYRYRTNPDSLSRTFRKPFLVDFLCMERRFWQTIQKLSLSRETRELFQRHYSHFLTNYLLKESLVCRTKKEFAALKKEAKPLLLPVDVKANLPNAAERLAWFLAEKNLFLPMKCAAKAYFELCRGASIQRSGE